MGGGARRARDLTAADLVGTASRGGHCVGVSLKSVTKQRPNHAREAGGATRTCRIPAP